MRFARKLALAAAMVLIGTIGWPLSGSEPTPAKNIPAPANVVEIKLAAPLWRRDTVPFWADQFRKAEKIARDQKVPILPPFIPFVARIATGAGNSRSLLVWRTFDGIHAGELETGERQWEARLERGRHAGNEAPMYSPYWNRVTLNPRKSETSAWPGALFEEHIARESGA
jgi:hypothetical protein